MIPAESSHAAQTRRRGRLSWLGAALAPLAVGIGVAASALIRWVCDDAFITFRYIQNLLAGHGLVYNVGERVEGYTHFLWIWPVAALHALGLDPVASSQILGLLFHAATLALFAAASVRIDHGRRFPFPITAFLLALHFDFQVWATGGLETALFTFLVAGAFWSIALTPAERGPRAALAGLLLALVVLCRPDGVVFLVVGGAFVALRAKALGRGLWRSAARFAVPVLLILVPYAIGKLAYYGDLLPNTYYAKSAGSSYWSQGFFYLALYGKAYLSSAVLLVGIAALARRRGGLLADPRSAGTLLAFAFVVTYAVGFVARVGGDFMFARFVIPLVPLVYFCGEAGLRSLFEGRRILLGIVTLALLLLVVQEKDRRDALFFDEEGERLGSFGVRGVTDEHWYWGHEDRGLTLIERHERIGRALGRYFEGEPVKVLLEGQASLGYYARFETCIEGSGLTDPEIARMPIEERGRPGHEKRPRLEHLERRGVHFEFLKRPRDPAFYRQATFRFEEGGVRGEMFHYDRSMMERIRMRFPDSVEFVDFPDLLDAWIERMPEMTLEEIEAGYREFRGFYFLHNDDPRREGRILSERNRRRSSWQAP